jgi:hypothetical protein
MPLLSRLFLLACASVAAASAADPTQDPSSPPWKSSFSTNVRGGDRTFVEHLGQTYVLIQASEITNGFGDGQEVALTAKLRRLPGDRFGFYHADGTVVTGTRDALAGKLDGDNLYLTGSLRLTDAATGQRIFTIRSALPAPSDAQLLAARQMGIAEDDWDRRLGVVSWCRDQARLSGSDAWSTTADAQLARIIDDMGTRSVEHRDVALVSRAIDLALGQLKDTVVASRIASPAWIRQHGGPQAEAISRRMRGLGFSVYQEKWLPRPQALEQEYEDRFTAMSWKDAEGFYKLGRWADDNAESLPRGRERSWRCYQAGNRADPAHIGLARELGLKPVNGTGTSSTSSDANPAQGTAFVDLETGLRVSAPAGWRHGPSQTNGIAWIDPESETATILVHMVRPPVDDNASWNLATEEARARPGFIEVAASETEVAPLRLRFLRSIWTEGEQQRYAALALAYISPDKPAAILEVRGLPSERPRLDAALDAAAASTTVQQATTTP